MSNFAILSYIEEALSDNKKVYIDLINEGIVISEVDTEDEQYLYASHKGSKYLIKKDTIQFVKVSDPQKPFNPSKNAW